MKSLRLKRPELPLNYKNVMTKEEVEQAIADAEYGRQTHVEWRDYLQSCYDSNCENCRNAEGYAGTLEHQIQWIERYDRILRVLKSISL